MQLCDAYDLPILFLCDTPGIMVGPDAEQTALVRHVSRLFVTGANPTVPFGTNILRKGYRLGAQAMAGGSLTTPPGGVRPDECRVGHASVSPCSIRWAPEP